MPPYQYRIFHFKFKADVTLPYLYNGISYAWNVSEANKVDRDAVAQASSHYGDVIMTRIASQITSLTVVYSIVYSGADQRKHQSSASLAFVQGIHRDRWIPRTKGQLRGKCFHLMTSSWNLSATEILLASMVCLTCPLIILCITGTPMVFLRSIDF